MVNKKWILFFLLIGLCIRILLPVLGQSNPKKGDGDEYYRYAWNLIHEGTYSSDISYPKIPDAGKMPGTSLLIAAGMLIFGEKEIGLLLPNILFSCLLLFPVFLYLRSLIFFTKLMLGIWILFCLIPGIEFYSGQFYPEVPAACSLLWGAWWLWNFLTKEKFIFLFASALAFSVGFLFRPELGINLIIVPIFFLFRNRIPLSKRIKYSSIWVGVGIAIVSPWIIRNLISTGNMRIVGDNFLIEKINTPNQRESCANGLYLWMNSWHFKEAEIKKVAWQFSQTDLDLLPKNAFRSQDEKNKIQSLQTLPYNCKKDSVLLGIAFDRIKSDPFSYYFFLPIKRIPQLLFRFERSDSFSFSAFSKEINWALWLIFALWMGALVILFFIGYWLKPKDFMRLLLFIFLARLFLFAWIYHVEARYMMLMFPLLIFGTFLSLTNEQHIHSRGTTKG